MYYTLGNLDLKYRSSLKSIQLLSVVKYTLVVKHGIGKILEPVVEAIKELEHVDKCMHAIGYWGVFECFHSIYTGEGSHFSI